MRALLDVLHSWDDVTGLVLATTSRPRLPPFEGFLVSSTQRHEYTGILIHEQPLSFISGHHILNGWFSSSIARHLRHLVFVPLQKRWNGVLFLIQVQLDDSNALVVVYLTSKGIRDSVLEPRLFAGDSPVTQKTLRPSPHVTQSPELAQHHFPMVISASLFFHDTQPQSLTAFWLPSRRRPLHNWCWRTAYSLHIRTLKRSERKGRGSGLEPELGKPVQVVDELELWFRFVTGAWFFIRIAPRPLQGYT